MNKRVSLFLHLAFWAFMFLSPLSYMRGHGVTLTQYLMNCMMPLLMMVVFYANYLWLTPRLFVAGKHRYFLLINLMLIVSLGIFLHYWMDLAREMFVPAQSTHKTLPMALDEIFFILRDIINLGIFAAVATAIVLAQRWENHEKARHEAEAARTEAELKTLRNQINPHFLLNTLNNIYALIAFDQDKAQTAVGELSKLLRHVLYENQQDFVPLNKEADFMRNYIELMKIRVTDHVKIEDNINVHPNDTTPVAPLIFISLIENAFKHGISPQGAGDITCEIRNSHYPKRENDKSGSGIGLEQVGRRLELMYPDCHTWEKGVTPDGKEYYSKITINTTQS